MPYFLFGVLFLFEMVWDVSVFCLCSGMFCFCSETLCFCSEWCVSVWKWHVSVRKCYASVRKWYASVRQYTSVPAWFPLVGHEIPRAFRGHSSEDLDRDKETERESTRVKVWIGSHCLAQAPFNVAIDPVISGLFSSRVDDHGALQEWKFLVRFKSIHRYLFDLGFSRMCLF